MSSGAFPAPRSRNARMREERQAHERANDEWTAAEVARLANEEIDRRAEEERRDAEIRANFKSTYRPDERELFADRAEHYDWEKSAKEWERYG